MQLQLYDEDDDSAVQSASLVLLDARSGGSAMTGTECSSRPWHVFGCFSFLSLVDLVEKQ